MAFELAGVHWPGWVSGCSLPVDNGLLTAKVCAVGAADLRGGAFDARQSTARKCRCQALALRVGSGEVGESQKTQRTKRVLHG